MTKVHLAYEELDLVVDLPGIPRIGDYVLRESGDDMYVGHECVVKEVEWSFYEDPEWPDSGWRIVVFLDPRYAMS